jgi:hypothetical protein
MLLALATLLAACATANNLPVAPTMVELCTILGRDPNTDPVCVVTDKALRDLLESAFPPGQTSQEQVSDKLHPYLIRRWVHANGYVIEEYAIRKTLFADDPDIAVFQYDENNLVRTIGIIE